MRGMHKEAYTHRGEHLGTADGVVRAVLEVQGEAKVSAPGA